MVVAVRAPSLVKRFLSDTFAPPAGFASPARGPEVTAEEILSGGVRESDWSFPVLVSTPSMDRHGDVVVPEGGDFTAFGASAIIFFDHQEIKFPVGKMRGPDGRLYLCVIPGKGILGRIWVRQPKADDPPAYAEACRTVWVLVRDGLLNGISAGFDPIGPVKDLRGGGSLYRDWELLEVSIVAIPANRECRVIREPFAWDEAVLKRFRPSVIKGLKTMTVSAIKGQHHNTHDIKYRNGKWVILDDKTRKVLSTHDSRSEALAAMRALQYGKHKSMSESSGTDGGYAVPQEMHATTKAIRERMVDHEALGHSLHFNPDTGELHHSYPDSESEDKIKLIAADLHDVPGVKAMTQEPETGPKGEGFHKVYPEKEYSHHSAVQKSAGHKSARRMSAVGKALFRAVQGRRLKGWGIDRAVQRLVPYLQKSGMSERRAVAVGWGVVCVKKGYLPAVTRDLADGDADEDDEDAPADEYEDMADDAATDAALDADEGAGEGPPGLELVQTAVENLEAALPRLEPETREFWEGIIAQIREHGEGRYPDEDFGGNDDKGEQGAKAGDQNDATEQKVSDQLLSRYKGYQPVRVKRISVVKKLQALGRDPETAATIRKTANHLHEIGDMHGEFDDKGCRLKGYTPAHHRACRLRAREMDRLHGAIQKDDAPAQPAATGQTDDDSYLNEIGPMVKSLAARVDGVIEKADGLHNQATGRRLF